MDTSQVVAVILPSVGLVVAAYKFKQWHDRRKPPFCRWCGISYHAPKEETRQACPRNPTGRDHSFEGSVYDERGVIAI